MFDKKISKTEILKIGLVCLFVLEIIASLSELYDAKRNSSEYHFGTNEYSFPFSRIYASQSNYMTYMMILFFLALINLLLLMFSKKMFVISFAFWLLQHFILITSSINDM